MEGIVFAIGAMVIAIGVGIGILTLGVLVSMWKTWWLHPLWALVVVPLGLPPISFWHFLALNMLWSAFHGLHQTQSGNSGQTKAEKNSAAAGTIFIMLLWPMLTFYMVRWYMR